MSAIEDKIQSHPVNETAANYLREVGQELRPAEMLPICQLAIWYLSQITNKEPEFQEARDFLELAQSNPLAVALECSNSRVELIRSLQEAMELGQPEWPLMEESLAIVNQELESAGEPEAAGAALVGLLIDNLTIYRM